MFHPNSRTRGRTIAALLFLAAGHFASVSAACTNPAFVTSDPNGGWSNGGYYVHNNMWNVSNYQVAETLYACAYDNWYVHAKMNNDNGDGAVKTYPNVHKDYNSVAITSFDHLTSTFAATSPHVGIYNVAYDIWLNGVATAGCTEVMIWTENYNQVPAGSKTETVTLGDYTYNVWKANGSSTYIAFVPTATVTSGSIDLLEIFNWIISKGWIPSNSTVGQICYGVEIVSTNGTSATFTFTDFSISTTASTHAAGRADLLMTAKSSTTGDSYYSPLGQRLQIDRERVPAKSSPALMHRASDTERELRAVVRMAW